MLWLGLETSCDESAAAVVEVRPGSLQVLGSQVSSQVARHERYGGVVPEVAVREHLRNLPVLTRELLRSLGLTPQQLQGVAVTEGPGLAPCLLIGHGYARGLAAALGCALAGVNHLEGHLLSPFMEEPAPFPFVGLVVSGGHTLLIEASDWGQYHKLGGTVDDAAGEVFDKVARLLGLGYPGGPQVEKMAREGNPAAYDFPQSFPEKDNFNFSFSGLKTSVRYFLEKNPAASVADVCASFQEAVVQVLVRKTVRAAHFRGLRSVALAGGVACNGRLREAMAAACQEGGLRLFLAGNELCTDNAAMIAAVAGLKAAQGLPAQIGWDINPNLPLAAQ